ncbi:MAG: GFA family protein [Pseudomonadota bacterium]
MEREASCACGRLRIACRGEPVRISICHCLACQRRTGSVFGMQARFLKENVRHIAGDSKRFTRKGDSGNTVSFHFCPDCGSTVYWELSGVPDAYAVAVGAFADPAFPAPRVSVYETRRHDWVDLTGLPDIERLG